MNRTTIRGLAHVSSNASDDAARFAFGVWARLLLGVVVTAMTASRQGQVERDMARLLAQSGGRLTDDIERRAMSTPSGSSFGNNRT